MQLARRVFADVVFALNVEGNRTAAIEAKPTPAVLTDMLAATSYGLLH